MASTLLRVSPAGLGSSVVPRLKLDSQRCRVQPRQRVCNPLGAVRASFDITRVSHKKATEQPGAGSKSPDSESQSLSLMRSPTTETLKAFNEKPAGQLLLETIGNVLGPVGKALQKPVFAGLLVALLLAATPDWALAASGGRMGGRSFSSGRSAPSQSYSAPSRGYSGGGAIFSAPYYAPSPFFYGGGGWGWSPFSFNIGPLFFFLIAVPLVINVAQGMLTGQREEGGGLFGGGEQTTVLRLQVGLLGLARSLQRDLERIAATADTSSSEGLHYVLTETILSLLRHPDYCVYGRTTGQDVRSLEAAEAQFNKLSLDERGKFEKETLVNVSGVERNSSWGKQGDGSSNEYIVVTILVAADGRFSLPEIRSNEDLRQALTTLGSIPADSIQAVEILWTPQDARDTLTERQLLADYPQLRAI